MPLDKVGPGDAKWHPFVRCHEEFHPDDTNLRKAPRWRMLQVCENCGRKAITAFKTGSGPYDDLEKWGFPRRARATWCSSCTPQYDVNVCYQIFQCVEGLS